MTKITDLTEIDALADNDLFYVRDASDPLNPDKKVPFSKIRPTGARIMNHYRYAGDISIPNIAADAQADVAITVTGAAVGDHVVFNPTATPAAGLVFAAAWVSAADTVTVRIRNVDPAVAFVAATLASVVLVSRSQ